MATYAVSLSDESDGEDMGLGPAYCALSPNEQHSINATIRKDLAQLAQLDATDVNLAAEEVVEQLQKAATRRSLANKMGDILGDQADHFTTLLEKAIHDVHRCVLAVQNTTTSSIGDLPLSSGPTAVATSAKASWSCSPGPDKACALSSDTHVRVESGLTQTIIAPPPRPPPPKARPARATASGSLPATTSAPPAVPVKAAPLRLRLAQSLQIDSAPVPPRPSGTQPSSDSAPPGPSPAALQSPPRRHRSRSRGAAHRQPPQGSASSVSAGGSDIQARASPEHIQRLSRALTKILRYDARTWNLSLFQDGFVLLADVLRVLRRRPSMSDVQEVVRTSLRGNGSPRFELRAGDLGAGPWIRANERFATQGATDAVDLADAFQAGPAEQPALSEERARKLSKALSAVLRHGSFDKQVSIYQNGFAPVEQVIVALRRHTVTVSDVRAVVRASIHRDGLPRFEIHEMSSGPWIRATRNHTIPGVDPSEAA